MQRYCPEYHDDYIVKIQPCYTPSLLQTLVHRVTALRSWIYRQVNAHKLSSTVARNIAGFIDLRDHKGSYLSEDIVLDGIWQSVCVVRVSVFDAALSMSK